MKEEKQRPTISTRAVRGLLLPLATFYTRVSSKGQDGEEESVELRDKEREVMADAAGKFVAETQGALRAWRISGDTRPEKELVRDPKSGLWPEPSVSFVGELMSAFGVVDQESAETRRHLEIARMETELEKERMSLERARLEYMSARMHSGLVVDEVDLRSISVPAATTPTLKRLAMYGEAAPVPLNRQGGPEPQMQVLALSAPDKQQSEMSEIAKEEPLQAAKPETLMDRILDCVRVAFCDLVWCVLGLVCVDGKFDRSIFENQQIMDELLDCLMEFVCSLLRCIAVALCPPEAPNCLPETANCDFAVEVS
ncbi:MAG: hypothetical protein ACI9VR_005343 [Cognaticolwellia sp.]